jgi:uncharacterized membrane protein
MTQREFIDAVSRHLKGLTDEEKRDILADYEEHFALGKEAGKSEEEIAAKLGDPKSLARQYRAGTMVRRAEEKHTVANVLNVVIAALALGMFNLIFVLPLFFAVLGVLVGLLGAALGIAVGGLASAVLSLASLFVAHWVVPVAFAGVGFFAGIGLACLGVLMCIGCFYIIKYTGIGLVKYVKFNINIASGERKQEEE